MLWFDSWLVEKHTGDKEKWTYYQDKQKDEFKSLLNNIEGGKQRADYLQQTLKPEETKELKQKLLH